MITFFVDLFSVGSKGIKVQNVILSFLQYQLGSQQALSLVAS
jgi:hypothetical protein